MRVLLVASEAFPLIKTGGLADVAGALPPALVRRGVDARLMLPAYPAALKALGPVVAVHDLGDLPLFGPTRLLEGRMPDSGAVVYLVDNPPLFDRPGGPYIRPDGWDHDDNFRRFALLARAAVILSTGGAVADWAADVVHANDWQTGLVPAFLKLEGHGAPRTVFCIHNLHFGGIFGPEVLPMVGLPPQSFSIHGLEFNGYLSYLKAGLYYADRLTTVSPTYAWEITTPEGGRGLDGLLRARADSGHLSGILNGVDYDHWDPASDAFLARPYGPPDVAAGKAACKAALQGELGLAQDPAAPLLGMVSRFSDQKGVDLVLQAAHVMADAGAQLVMVGSGDSGLESALRALPAFHPGKVAVRVGYDEPLAHRVQAAADLFLVPSRFEPCGLTQLYALRYGTLPLVRRTGGLADTVMDLHDERRGTGFLFDAPTVEGLLAAFFRAMAYYQHPQAWALARQRAMAQDFGWDRAADDYVALFDDMVGA